MSAYAALVSVLRILETILDSGGPLILHTRPHVQLLKQKVILLLDFLESSSAGNGSQTTPLETRIRLAAYEAEDLLESHVYRILDFRRDRLAVHVLNTLAYIFYAYTLVSSNTAVSYADVIPVLAVVAVSTAVVAYAHQVVHEYICSTELIFDHEVQEIELMRRVLKGFTILEEDLTKTNEAGGGGGTQLSAHAALLSLQQILNPILESGGWRISLNRSHLERLHEKVSFLLDFLGNASVYVEKQESELKDMDTKIVHAANKAKALMRFQIPWRFSLDSDWRRLFMLSKVTLNVSLFALPPFAFEVIHLLEFMNYQLIHASFPIWIQILMQFFLILALAYVLLVLFFIGITVSVAIRSVVGYSKAPETRELPIVISEFSIIMRTAIEIEDACGIYLNNLHAPSPPPPPPPSSSSSSSTPNSTSSSSSYTSSSSSLSSRRNSGGTDKDVVVGLDSDLHYIKARLVQDSSKRELVSIVGMGGIGKTTLATHVYNDPYICSHFDVRAWTTVSQDYSLRNVLMSLLDSAKMMPKEKRDEDDHQLADYLSQRLMYMRYLIVIDDMWDVEIWDFLSRFFRENDNGSRVLITSRLSGVASYLDSDGHPHHMRCLNDDDSWNLLCRKVFGEGGCPIELESTAREIARNCKGLPLAIVVIGGLLYKENLREIWIGIAKNLSSNLRQTEEECSKILGLSYNHLPHHLRPCFLYMGFFPGDYEIHVSKLISLWVAEGFLKPCKSKNLEELAEDYLKDLIDRNLVFACKKSCNGKIRTCSIHGLLRGVCVQNANKENFFHIVDRRGYIARERTNETPRRKSICADARLVMSSRDYYGHSDYGRSLLCTASKLVYDYYPSDIFFGHGYLRVLDLIVLHFSEFPNEIINLTHLRYLALHFDGSFPESMSNLKNLETILHHYCSFCKDLLLPRTIWSMPNLRHLYVKPGCYLSDPLSDRLHRKSLVLEHLQTLVGIRNVKWSRGIIERIPNMKKLGISYDVSSSVDWSMYGLESLVDLHQLETLKIIIKNDDDLGLAISHDPPKLVFPHKLKKLTLSGCGIPWASMTTIGALPDLESLKLRWRACFGPSWTTVEGEFPKLTFLLLEQMHFTLWKTDEAHFPRLKRLVIRSCGMLQEIPSTIGDIPTLEMIELVDCRRSLVASAIYIQEEQEKEGNVDLKVFIAL